MNHRLAGLLQAQIGLMGILQDVQQGSPGIVQPFRLSRHPSAILFIIAQDMDHGFTLLGQSLVELIQIAHDMDQGATALFSFAHALFQDPYSLMQSGLGLGGKSLEIVLLCLYKVRGIGHFHCLLMPSFPPRLFQLFP